MDVESFSTLLRGCPRIHLQSFISSFRICGSNLDANDGHFEHLQ